MMAMCRAKRGRVREGLEVVIVRPIVDVHLGVERVATLPAGLPGAVVAFGGVMAAEREAAMIASAAVVGKGEEHVGVLIVANPSPTAVRAGCWPDLTAELAGWTSPNRPRAGRLGERGRALARGSHRILA